MALTLGELANGGGLRRGRGRGLGEMTPADYKSACQAIGGKAWNKYYPGAAPVFARIHKAYADGRARLRSASSKLESVQRRAFDLSSSGADVSSVLDEVDMAIGTVSGAAADLDRAWGDFESAVKGQHARGGCAFYKGVGGKSEGQWENMIRSAGAVTIPSQSRILNQLNTIESSLAKRAATERASAAAEASRVAAEQAAADQARQLAFDRQEREYSRQQEVEDRRIAREDAARSADLEFQRAQIADQRQMADEDRAREQHERDQIAAIEQQAIDRAAALEQQALDRAAAREQQEIRAADRRMQLEEAASIRVAEAALRREEREAQLQQLMMIQELAASGLPVNLLPPGLAPPQPQQQRQPQQFQPGLSPQSGGVFTLPGFAQQPQAQPQQQLPPGAWSPYGQVVQGPAGPAPTGFAPQVPGVAFAQGPPGVPAGYAAQPAAGAFTQGSLPPQMQQPFPQQPAAPAPPGFAWGGFDPGTEMFGMGGLGDLLPTVNPNLQGALIEENWFVRGPNANGQYAIFRPSGQVFGSYTEDQLFQGAIRDKNNETIFIPPSQRPSGGGDAAAITASVASVLAEAIKAVGSVETEKERRKSAKAAAKARASASFPSLSLPGGGYAPEPQRARTPTAVYVMGGLALAAGAFFVVPKMFGAKKK